MYSRKYTIPSISARVTLVETYYMYMYLVCWIISNSSDSSKVCSMLNVRWNAIKDNLKKVNIWSKIKPNDIGMYFYWYPFLLNNKWLNMQNNCVACIIFLYVIIAWRNSVTRVDNKIKKIKTWNNLLETCRSAAIFSPCSYSLTFLNIVV